MTRRSLATAVIGAVLLLLAARPAGAHAVLESTTPADRAQLDAAPSEVRLEFNEAVSAPVGSVRVFDAGGERVDDGDVRSQDGTLTLGLQPDLGEGAYIVTYRVISADAHPITGAFTFTVGDVDQASDDTVAGLLGSEDDSTWDIAGGVARAFAYAGTLVAAGLGAFLVLAHDGGAETNRLRRWLRWAAAIGAVAVVVAIPVAAARVTGLGLGSVFEDGIAEEVLQDGVGLSTAVVLAGLVALVIGVGRNRPVAIAGAVAATAGFALAGHTTTGDPRWLVTITDAVHVVAAAAWLGGLVGLAIVLHARRADSAGTVAPIVGRFSSVAALALVGVAVCGLVVGWREVRTLDALTSTTYGKVLLAKVAVVAAVAAMGAWNRFRLVPAIETAPRKAGEQLRRFVVAESLGLLVAVGFTAALVNITPAATAAGIGEIFSETVPFGDGSVNVVVDPNRVGENEIHLYLYDDAGRVADLDLDEITLELSLPSAELGPLQREPFLAGAGHYQLDTTDLSIPGDWTIDVVARVDTFDQLTASVTVPVNP